MKFNQKKIYNHNYNHITKNHNNNNKFHNHNNNHNSQCIPNN